MMLPAFYVAVDDPLSVSRGERVGHLQTDRKQRLKAHRPPSIACLKVLPSTNCMAMKGGPVPHRFVNGADVRVIEAEASRAFPQKTPARLAVTSECRVEQLSANFAASLTSSARNTSPIPPRQVAFEWSKGRCDARSARV